MPRNLQGCVMEAVKRRTAPPARSEGRPDPDMGVVNEQIRNPPAEVQAAYARLGEVARKFRAMKAAKPASDV